MNTKHFNLFGFLLLALLAACRFQGSRQNNPPKPEDPASPVQSASMTPEPIELVGGFASPVSDIASLPPVIYPPVAETSTDCLQGPEPDWSAPSARLFEWPDPFTLPNRLLCLYAFPEPEDGWGFTVELTDPAGNIFLESFTIMGDDLMRASGGKQSFLPSIYDGVPYIGLPLFFGDPQAEGKWQVSARSLDAAWVLDPSPVTVEGIFGIYMLSAPPGNPFDVFPLEIASDGQTAYIYLVGGQPNSEYVIALYTIDPDMVREFNLQPGDPAPDEMLAISTLVPQFATVLNSDQHGNVETRFYVDASIPAGQYFLVVSPGVRGSLAFSLIPMLVRHD